MKKSALILIISLPFVLYSVKAYAEVCISQWQGYYCYWNHWLSDEGWGAEVTDFDDADKVYCNVSAGMGAPEPWKSPSFYELRWFKPDGERESNIGTCFNGYCLTKEYVYQGGVIVGWYSWMIAGDIYREPGQWRIEHWADGYVEGIGSSWHKLFTASFRIPPRPFISVSPTTFWSLQIKDSIDCSIEYTDGFTFDGTYFWVADWWEEKIFKLDTSGNIISFFDSPGICPGDLASDGASLWNSDYCNEKIYQLDTTGKIIAAFDSPGSSPAGLAFDGEFLWNSDSWEDKIFKLDTSGNVISFFDSPGSSPSELAFDGKYLWNIDSKLIYKLDNSGSVIDFFEHPGISGSYPDGLAFYSTYLWIIYGDDRKIYKSDPPKAVIVGFTKTQTFTVTSEGTINLVVDAMTITGADDSEFGIKNNTCFEKSLPQQATCTFNVEFSPTSPGEKSAILKITSNHTRSPTLIPLRGLAIAGVCEGDLNHDSDVDGADLAAHIKDSAGISLIDFAADFGRINCPQG